MMELKTFWKGLGAVQRQPHCKGDLTPFCSWEINNFQVGKGPEGYEEYLDPADAEEVPLEVLLGGLERLAKNAFVFYDGQTFGYAVIRNFSWSVDPKNILSLNPDRRTAIISAIERLIEEAENVGK